MPAGQDNAGGAGEACSGPATCLLEGCRGSSLEGSRCPQSHRKRAFSSSSLSPEPTSEAIFEVLNFTHTASTQAEEDKGHQLAVVGYVAAAVLFGFGVTAVKGSDSVRAHPPTATRPNAAAAPHPRAASPRPHSRRRAPSSSRATCWSRACPWTTCLCSSSCSPTSKCQPSWRRRC